MKLQVIDILVSLERLGNATPCMKEACLGSVLLQHVAKTTFQARPAEEVLTHAKDFLQQYFASIKSEEAAKVRKKPNNGLTTNLLAKIAS